MGVVSLVPKQDNELRASIEEMRRSMPDMIEANALRAKMKWSYYSALIKEGFTPDQCMMLVMDDEG